MSRMTFRLRWGTPDPRLIQRAQFHNSRCAWSFIGVSCALAGAAGEACDEEIASCAALRRLANTHGMRTLALEDSLLHEGGF